MSNTPKKNLILQKILLYIIQFLYFNRFIKIFIIIQFKFIHHLLFNKSISSKIIIKYFINFFIIILLIVLLIIFIIFLVSLNLGFSSLNVLIKV